ncbi:MAG TPA: hypothetical protein VD929_07970 [Caulobacteraceae bacterium]|nr:hypothetical protein [Caulobacteraceae bacterium]
MARRRPRPTRRDRRDAGAWAVQSLILDEVARGRRRPANQREEFYRRLLDAGVNPDPAQFVLPRALWVLETSGDQRSD